MKVTVLKNNDKKDFSIFYSVILFILGVILTFNSTGLLNIIFDVLGALIVLVGIYYIYQHYIIKTNYKNSSSMIRGITFIIIGILIIILSTFITNAIQIVTGIWLIFTGLNKLSFATLLKDTDQKNFFIQLGCSILLIVLGIYSIVSTNIIFVFIGIVLIIYSVFDIVNYFMTK